jgi:sialate O-acetylesterase
VSISRAFLGAAALSLVLDAGFLHAVEPPLLHALFSDHAVLPRDRPIPVWGTAKPADEVTVALAGAQVVAKADASGRWSADLPALPAGGPHELTARTRSGATQTVRDVLVGDVWLCSGQSNMALTVSRSLSSQREIAGSANDRIRALTVANDSSPTALDAFVRPVEWKLADPANTGGFSAVCYYFARELQQTAKVPMGMVVSAWGGSKINPWLSLPALRALGGNDALLDVLAEYPKSPSAAAARFGTVWREWWKGASSDAAVGDPWDPASSGSWRDAPPGLGYWENWGVPELADYNGIVLYRTRVRLTADQAKRDATLTLGNVDEIDMTWVNGRGVGSSSGGDRSYKLAAGVLREGDNDIVVSDLDTYLTGGINGPAEKRALLFDDGTSLPLAGPWQYRIAPKGIGLPPRAPWESTAGLGTIYNAMVAPLGRFGFRGALWYQGESNGYLSEAGAYESQMRALMADWRSRFGTDLAFFVAEIANYGAVPTAPVESGWAQVRDGQRRAVAADARAGLAVTIDVGEPYELHPANKQEVGRRLALAARRVVYGEAVKTGPQPVAATRQGAQVVVSFRDVDGALLAKSGKRPTAFELCGAATGSCRFADATLGPDSISLDTTELPNAARVRYCWADAPVCTLVDGSGLPAPPFELEIR